MITINCNYFTHNNKECVLLQFPYDKQLNKIFTNLTYTKYSSTHKAWYILKNKELLKNVIENTNNIATLNLQNLQQQHKQNKIDSVATKNKVAVSLINDFNKTELQKFVEFIVLKGYSQATLTTYRNEFIAFLQSLKNVNANAISEEKIKSYLFYCHTVLKLSENTLHSRINALKFYYEQVLKRDKFFYEIPRPKKPFILPKVISEEKIIEVLLQVQNLKHKAILLLAYSAGLRVSEVVILKITDIDSNRMQIRITAAKGKKDRVAQLSKNILLVLREYYKEYEPKFWLFEGQIKGAPYSMRSAQIIFKEAYKNAGLPTSITFHSLRHSYATHLLENGTDIKYIQKLLGHNDIKTTLRYIHVSNKDIGKIESPLDKIMRKLV